MLCEKCNKNNATLFYEENINGKKRKLSLCESCANELKKKGELWSGEDFFEDMMTASPFPTGHDSLFGSLFGLPGGLYQKSEERCRVCNSSFADFKKRGKAGCPSCYSIFAEQLEPTIRSIHGNAKHSGRSPKALRAKHQREDELKSLRIELKDAISTENFEKAALLRDKIKSIENQNTSNA